MSYTDISRESAYHPRPAAPGEAGPPPGYGPNGAQLQPLGARTNFQPKNTSGHLVLSGLQGLQGLTARQDRKADTEQGLAAPYSHGLTDFILQHAPDFCWCSGFDLFVMTEVEFPDVTENTFAVTLSQLKRKGFFITKPNPAPRWSANACTSLRERGRKGWLYLRVKPATADSR